MDWQVFLCLLCLLDAGAEAWNRPRLPGEPQPVVIGGFHHAPRPNAVRAPEPYRPDLPYRTAEYEPPHVEVVDPYEEDAEYPAFRSTRRSHSSGHRQHGLDPGEPPHNAHHAHHAHHTKHTKHAAHAEHVEHVEDTASPENSQVLLDTHHPGVHSPHPKKKKKKKKTTTTTAAVKSSSAAPAKPSGKAGVVEVFLSTPISFTYLSIGLIFIGICVFGFLLGCIVRGCGKAKSARPEIPSMDDGPW